MLPMLLRQIDLSSRFPASSNTIYAFANFIKSWAFELSFVIASFQYLIVVTKSINALESYVISDEVSGISFIISSMSRSRSFIICIALLLKIWTDWSIVFTSQTAIQTAAKNDRIIAIKKKKDEYSKVELKIELTSPSSLSKISVLSTEAK